MTDQKFDKGKMETLQNALQSDPKALEKILNGITQDQIGAALNIFNSLDQQTQTKLAEMAINIKNKVDNGK